LDKNNISGIKELSFDNSILCAAIKQEMEQQATTQHSISLIRDLKAIKVKLEEFHHVYLKQRLKGLHSDFKDRRYEEVVPLLAQIYPALKRQQIQYIPTLQEKKIKLMIEATFPTTLNKALCEKYVFFIYH
jgi:hypothetical protein